MDVATYCRGLHGMFGPSVVPEPQVLKIVGSPRFCCSRVENLILKPNTLSCNDFSYQYQVSIPTFQYPARKSLTCSASPALCLSSSSSPCWSRPIWRLWSRAHCARHSAHVHVLPGSWSKFNIGRYKCIWSKFQFTNI